MFMSASTDLKFHHWPHMHREVLFKPQKSSPCACASWSKDNAYLAYMAEKTRPEIFSVRDLNNIKLVHSISAVNDVSCVCFQRTTKRCMALGSQNGQVVLYDTKSKQIKQLFKNSPSAVRFVDFNSEDEILGVACKNGNVVLYDTSNGDVCGNYVISDNAEPTCLRFHPTHPHLLAASSQEGAVMVWDTATANKTYFAQAHTSGVRGIAFGKDNKGILISVGDDRKFCVHDLNIRECIFRSTVHQPLSAIDVSPDGVTVAMGSEDGTIFLYDARHFLVPKTSWKAHPTRITKIIYENPTIDQCPFVAASSSETISPITEAQNAETSSVIEVGVSTMKISCVSKKTITDGPQRHNEYLKKMKAEIVSAIQKNAEEVTEHLRLHMTSMEDAVKREFKKMDEQMNEKWEMVNLVALNYGLENEDGGFSDVIDGTHIEGPSLTLD